MTPQKRNSVLVQRYSAIVRDGDRSVPPALFLARSFFTVSIRALYVIRHVVADTSPDLTLQSKKRGISRRANTDDASNRGLDAHFRSVRSSPRFFDRVIASLLRFVFFFFSFPHLLLLLYILALFFASLFLCFFSEDRFTARLTRISESKAWISLLFPFLARRGLIVAFFPFTLLPDIVQVEESSRTIQVAQKSVIKVYVYTWHLQTSCGY